MFNMISACNFRNLENENINKTNIENFITNFNKINKENLKEIFQILNSCTYCDDKLKQDYYIIEKMLEISEQVNCDSNEVFMNGMNNYLCLQDYLQIAMITGLDTRKSSDLNFNLFSIRTIKMKPFIFAFIFKLIFPLQENNKRILKSFFELLNKDDFENLLREELVLEYDLIEKGTKTNKTFKITTTLASIFVATGQAEYLKYVNPYSICCCLKESTVAYENSRCISFPHSNCASILGLMTFNRAMWLSAISSHLVKRNKIILEAIDCLRKGNVDDNAIINLNRVFPFSKEHQIALQMYLKTKTKDCLKNIIATFHQMEAWVQQTQNLDIIRAFIEILIFTYYENEEYIIHKISNFLDANRAQNPYYNLIYNIVLEALGNRQGIDFLFKCTKNDLYKEKVKEILKKLLELKLEANTQSIPPLKKQEEFMKYRSTLINSISKKIKEIAPPANREIISPANNVLAVEKEPHTKKSIEAISSTSGLSAQKPMISEKIKHADEFFRNAIAQPKVKQQALSIEFIKSCLKDFLYRLKDDTQFESLLTQKVIRNNGLVLNNLAEFTAQEQKILLTPFSKFLAMLPRTKWPLGLELIELTLSYFDIFCTDPQVLKLAFDGSLDKESEGQLRAVVGKIKLASTQQIPRIPLSVELTKQVAPIFVKVKFKELEHKLINYSKEKVEHAGGLWIPCYFLKSDGPYVNVKPLQAYFDKHGEIKALQPDTGQIAQKLLTQLLDTTDPKISLYNQKDGNESFEIGLSLKQIKILQNTCTAKKNNPPFILLPYAANDDAQIVFRTIKRKREEEYETPAKRAKYDRKRSDEASESQKILEASELQINMDSAAAVKDNNDEGLGFWADHNLESCDSLKSQIKIRSVEQDSSLELTPLKFPLLEKMKLVAEAADLSSYPVLNRLLKSYQIEEIEKIERYYGAGLGRVLAFQMGLGKSLTAIGFMERQLTRAECIQVITMPRGLGEQFKEQALQGLAESALTAWELALKEADLDQKLDTIYARLADIKEKSDLDDLLLLIRILALTPKNKLRAAELKKDFRESISKAVLKHLRTLKENYVGNDQLLIKKQLTELFSNNIHPHFCHLKNKVDDWTPDEFAAPFQLEQASYHLSLAGKILNINPGRQQLSSTKYNGLNLTSFLNYSPKMVLYSEKKEEVKKFFQKFDAKSAIIITTIGCVEDSFKEGMVPSNISTFMVDEAQRAHNETTNAFEALSNITNQLGPNVAKIVMTATPCENNFLELWNLLSLANPGGLKDVAAVHLSKELEDTHSSLHRYLLEPDTSEKKVLNKILSSFFYFFQFKHVANQLVTHISMQDPVVKTQWNGRIPKRVDKEIISLLPSELHNELNSIPKKLNQFKYENIIKRMLINRNWKDVSIDLDDNQAALDWLKELEYKNLSHVLKDSALLNQFITQKTIKNIFNKQQKAIIFVEHKITACALEIIIKRYYRELQSQHSSEVDEIPIAKIIDGKQTSKLRNKHIEWFKKTSKSPKFLILLIKVAGVGFNLQEADKVINVTNGFNESALEQAYARAIRANTIGKRKVISFNFGTFLEKHQKAIRKEKENFTRFLLKNYNANPLEQLEDWLAYLKSACYHWLLLKEKKLSDQLKNEGAYNPAIIHKELAETRSALLKLNKLFKSFNDDEVIKLVYRQTKTITTSDHMGENIFKLPNLGNTCYFNAALQLLMSSTWFKALIEAESIPFARFFSEEKHDLKKACTLALNAIQMSGHSEFRDGIGQQKDAAACLEAIFQLCNFSNPEESLSYYSNKGLLHKISRTPGQQVIFTLGMDHKEHSMQKLIDAELSQQKISNVCIDDKGLIQLFDSAYKVTRLKVPAQIIPMQIKRFKQENGVLKKDSSLIEVPLQIDMKAAFGSANSVDYHLTGFIIHEGDSITCGHYVAYTFHNNAWYKCNDSEVSSVSEEFINQEMKKAYLLLWEKANDIQPEILALPSVSDYPVQEPIMEGIKLDGYCALPCTEEDSLDSFLKAIKLGDLAYKGEGDSSIREAIGGAMASHNKHDDKNKEMWINKLKDMQSLSVEEILKKYSIYIYNSMQACIQTINHKEGQRIIRLLREETNGEKGKSWNYSYLVRMAPSERVKKIAANTKGD